MAHHAKDLKNLKTSHPYHIQVCKSDTLKSNQIWIQVKEFAYKKKFNTSLHDNLENNKEILILSERTFAQSAQSLIQYVERMDRQ